MELTEDDVRTIIDTAGGAKTLAVRMGLHPSKGYARIRRWASDGYIPPMVVLAYKPLFARLLAKAEKAAR